MNFDDLKPQLNNQLQTLQGDVALQVKFINNADTFSYNADKQFWAASVIKVPIACTLYKTLVDKSMDINTYVHVKEENYVQGSGVLKLLDHNNNYTYKDLLTLMLTVSDNVATNELIDVIGWEAVEEYMHQLGLKNTTFKHKMMVSAGRGPNLTTTEDMNKLLELLYHSKIAGAQEILSIMSEQIDRTRIPLYIPNNVRISHKYGSLPQALHEIGIVYATNPFLFSFFSDDQPDKKLTNLVLSNCAKLCFGYSENT